jgi:hypothetical protein
MYCEFPLQVRGDSIGNMCNRENGCIYKSKVRHFGYNFALFERSEFATLSKVPCF